MYYHIGRSGMLLQALGIKSTPVFQDTVQRSEAGIVSSHLYERKKVTSAIFLLEMSLPDLDGGVNRLYKKAFLPWSDLVCPFPMQAPYSALPVLPLRQDGNAPGVDLMASRVNIQCLTIKTLLASDATWGAIRVTFWNASQAKTAGGNICHLSACARP